MNRRILLIDADPAFHASITKQLARFRFDIVHEADGERAQAMAVADPPALLIVAVEEPEKAGFKLFQKLRKGATAKVPIMLVTSSMTTESFSKHKALKVHADDYLDKRTQSDELLGKLEQLVGLGDPIEDDMDIPMEVDEIPLAEGDMVLEETIGEDDIQEFDDPHNAGTRNMAVDQLVDAEIDAGFAAMFGDDDAGGVPIAAVHEHVHEEAAPPPPPAPVAAAIHDNASVPVPVHDSGVHDFDSFDEEPARMPSHSRAPVAIDEDDAINSRDMIPIEDLAAAADAEMAADVVEERHKSTQVEAPPRKPPSSSLIPVVVDNEAEHEFSQNDMVTRAAPVNQKLLEELSIPVAVAHVNRPTGETMAPPITNMTAIDPPTSPPSALANAQVARSKRESMQPIVDLGLDEIAVRAESEQSGVHDRRALQKVGELERQIAQLKTELERARSAPATPASRANDFVNLREQIAARDKDLQKAKDDLSARDHEIKDALDKARQAQQARSSLEAKAQELEQRHANAQTQIATLEGREKALGGQVSALKDELDARAQAVSNAEQNRLQIERDLAAERARAAAGASDAERSLRLEREQLISRHQGELAGARGEAEKLREAALASLKAELEAEHGKAIAVAAEAAKKAAKAEHDKGKITLVATHAGELEALKQQYGQELEALEKEHGDALANARGEVETAAKKHAEALAAAGAGTEALSKQHADALAKQAQEHAEDLETARAGHAAAADAHAAELEKLASAAKQSEAAHAAELEKLGAESAQAQQQTIAAHTAELARVEKEHAAALQGAQQAAEAASSGGAVQIAELREEHAAAIEKLTAAKKHEQGAALDKVRAEHAAETEKLRAGHAKALEAAGSEHDQLRAEHATALEAVASEHAAAVEQLRAQMDAQRADAEKALVAKTGDHLAMIEAVKGKQAEALEGARKDHDALSAKHEAAKAELIEAHRRATEAMTTAHAEQLAKLSDEKQRAVDDIQKAATDHRQITEKAQRELDEKLATQRAATEAAKKAAEDAAKTHQAEIESARQAIVELKASHERALAAANAELAKQKSVGDADHKKAIAALVDDHAKTIADLQREKDELGKGLSGARENTKRVDAELAAAVQTIADRNAELRNHTAAIAERDARLVELRKELDSLEAENASYQEQVLRAYQKIKTDEAMVARAKKAMAIALTVLDDQGNAS